MNELGLMGWTFDMGGDPSMMGGGMPSMGGVAQSMGGYSMDYPPEFLELAQQYGVEPGSPDMDYLWEMYQQSKSSGDTISTRSILGQPAPQLGSSDFEMLAQQFGISPTPGALGGEDPMYSNQYDIASMLGGAYEP